MNVMRKYILESQPSLVAKAKSTRIIDEKIASALILGDDVDWYTHRIANA